MKSNERNGSFGWYRSIHLWVERQLGKPSRCELCGTTEPRRYNWSNISREYKRDLSDWRRLCVPCHKKEDSNGKIEPHKLTAENTYTYPNGRKECRSCRASRHLQSNHKQSKATQ